MQFSRSSKSVTTRKKNSSGPRPCAITSAIIVIDQQWKDHLLSMDHLKEGIGLRGYGRHDPLVEYKKESFDMPKR